MTMDAKDTLPEMGAFDNRSGGGRRGKNSSLSTRNMAITAGIMFVTGALAGLALESAIAGCSPFLCSAKGGHCEGSQCVPNH